METATRALGTAARTPAGVLQTIFRPFSCKGFYLCPSCSQKRTLLFAEHLTNEVLLDVPHRQFVFTMPKALRPFFRHDQRLFAEVSRLIYTIISEFYAAAAGKPLLTGTVSAFQSFGDQLRWNAHLHSLVVEGGFDEAGRFIHVQLSGLHQMTEVFRRRLIWLLVEKELLAEDFAQNLLSWKDSGFSMDNSVCLTDAKSKESLAEYIARPPLSLKKIHYEPLDDGEEVTVDARKQAWAGLLAKVYEIDPLVCPKCGSEMKCSFATAKLRQFCVAELQLSAVIQDPVEIRDILTHLVKTGRAPPDLIRPC